MKRGEVWWANLPLPAGRRPVVIVSREIANVVRMKVIVAELSTMARGIPTEVALAKRDGVPRACVINADNIVTIPKSWLVEKVASLRATKRAELDAALRYALALE